MKDTDQETGRLDSAQSNVYVITDGASCKIGVTSDVTSRLRGLQTANANKLSVAYSMKCKNSRIAYKVEKRSHKILSHNRVEGEWFSCGVSEAISSVCEAVLDVASSEFSYVDLPRGGELALSSRATRYVRHMNRHYGLKAADIVDEALVEYFGPIVDGGRSRPSASISKFDAKAYRKTIIDTVCGDGLPISRLRRKKGLGRMSEIEFNSLIDGMISDGAIFIDESGRGSTVRLSSQANSAAKDCVRTKH